MRSLWMLLALAALLSGCPETASTPAEDAPCERVGDRCRLSDGPIGVCNDTGRTDCDEPPCLACMPQH